MSAPDIALPMVSLLPWLDVAGLSVFAASGALAAARQRLDFVGACFFALITATVLFAWAAVTVAIFVNQLLSADERAEVARKQAAATAAEARIAQYRDRVGEIAADLDERQAQLEEWQKTYFGAEALPAAADDDKTGAAADKPPETNTLKTSAVDPRLPPVRQLYR